MKTLIHLKIQTILLYQNKIINKATLLLIILFFIQTTQAKTKLTGKFLINNNLSSTSLELKENNLYNSKSEKEGGVISISNDSIYTSKNSTFREVANVYLNRIEEGNNATQLYYILKQNFKNAISLENIAVVNQPFPNPDTDGDGVTDDVDLDDDNDGTLDVLESQGPCNVGYLSYEFYSENPSGNTVDNIPTTGAIATGTIENFNASDLQSSVGDTGSFAVRYTGYISITTNGTYTFFTSSDDGSKLYIDGVEIVNNDGTHSTQERSGTVTLDAGVHPITVLFFQGGGGLSLSASYAGPFIAKTDLPFNILYSQYCILDTDEDGVPNSLDLDSDNDGCSDALEAGAIDDGTTTDVNNNGLLDQYEDGTTGTISYVSRYNIYAIDNTNNACLDADNDGDGYTDFIDLDDDNDGILDVLESQGICNNGGSLNFEFYSDSPSGDTVDNIPTTEALTTGTISNFNVSALQSSVGDTGSFAVRYTGYISITTNGTYTFFTSSDDGSKLYIDGVEIVNNDGTHSTQERFGSVILEEGVYFITILFYQVGGGVSLSASYSGPSISKTSLPFNILAPELVYCFTDTDGDGIPNRLDLDSDGDGCSDAIEGDAAFTNSDLVNSLMPGGNTGAFYTGQYNSPVVGNLGTTVDSNGVPTLASGGQAIGTATTANHVLDETANQALEVSDVNYTAGNAVFTISNALANITYELVDDNGDSLSPQVLATQGASISDLDLILLQANVPLAAPATTYQVIAGIPGACRVTLTDQPVLTIATTDSDNDGVADALDLDDDNDGILDDQEVFSINGLSPQLWLDATDYNGNGTTYSDGTLLSTDWIDKSGNGNHYSLVFGPTYQTSEINGRDVVEILNAGFNGPAGAATSTSEWTVVMVTKLLSSDADGRLFDGHTSNYILGYHGGRKRAVYFDGNPNAISSVNGTTVGVTDFEMNVYVRSASGVMNLYSNGNTLNSYNSTTSTNGIIWDINQGAKSNESSDSQIGDFIIIPTALTDEDRLKLEGYLAHKWGLENNLPIGHPYKANFSTDIDNDGIPNRLDLDSDGDGCPDAIEGAAAFTTADLVASSMDGGNSGAFYTGEYNSPVVNNLGTTIDSNGIPTIAATGQETGTAIIANPVLDETANQALAVSDVNYTAGNAVFTITNALANITYELVDDNGDSLSPQVIATQGASTSDLDLTLLEANVPLASTSTTYQVIAGISGACRVTLTDQPVLFQQVILITQVYQSNTKKMIEVTNIGGGQIPGGTFTLNLFSNNSGDMTGLTPSASYTITSTLNANQSIVIENNAGGGFSNINSGAISITDDNITNFSDGNDILVLSTSSDTTSWTNRLDVIHSISNITSMVLNDERSDPVTTHVPDRWSVFIDDNLDPYRDAVSGGPERHPHDPLISEIDNAIENSNTQLGYHRIGITRRIDGNWSNGTPDRARRVIINEDYLHNNGSHLSARQLTIDNNSKLTIQDKLLIVSDLVTITGINDEIRLAGSRSQLITTHSGNSGISGNGKLYIDQNSDIPSTYRYNYFSSPVTTVGQNTFTIASVMKDGSFPTSADSNPLDITFTNEMDGDYTTSPITISDYWIYSYGSSSDWVQTRKDGILNPADGFTLKGPGQEQNYTFVGTPNDGVTSISIGANQSYLVGNPFPSAINSKKFIEDNSESITGTLYFWEQHPGHSEENDNEHYSSNYVGGYATRNLTMGIAAPNNGEDGVIFKIPGKYIAVAQGFFITGSNTGGEVVFKNSQREYKREGEDSLFFRDGENSSTETYQDPVVKIGLDYTNSEGQNLHRQLGVSFNENRSFSFDLGYDSPLYEPLENDIQYRAEETKMFWKFDQDDTKYVIAGIQEFSTDIEIPIGFSLEYDGEITVKLDEQQNFEQEVYLKDKLTGATYKLSDNEQGVAITLSTGSHLDKYAIVFVESSLNTDDDMLLENQLGVYIDNMANELVLKNYQNLDIKKVGLYNILGQTIKTWNRVGTDTEYRKEVQLPAAIYVVRITTENGEFLKKIRVE